MEIDFDLATKILLNEGVIAMNTDTVYGLLASFSSEKAIETIYKLKKRPREKALILLLDSVESVFHYTSQIPPGGLTLMKRFWPGPLTLILPANLEIVPSSIRAGQKTIAIRVPAAPLLQKLIEAVGPLVAPSANLANAPPATSVEELENVFSKDLPILVSDTLPLKTPSTLLGYESGKWKVIREGAISSEHLFLDDL